MRRPDLRTSGLRTSALRGSALVLAAAPPVALLAVVDPNRPGHYPVCPVKALTGLDCPGCGSLRAIHALSQGDVLGALDHNVLFVLFLPLLVVSAVLWALVMPQPAWLSARHTGWAVFAVVIGWAVVRNLPLTPLTVLRSS